MTNQDEFFTPEEVDRQIERVSQFQEGDRADAELIAYLHSFSQTDTQQETLDRLWNRIAPAIPSEQDQQEQEKELYMQDRQTQSSTMGRLRPQHPRRTSLMQQLGVLAAAVFLVGLDGVLALALCSAR